MIDKCNKALLLSDIIADDDMVNIFLEKNILLINLGKRLGNLPDKILYRHLHYFIIAFKGLINSHKFDIIIFWQQYIGIYYLLLSFLIFNTNRPCILFYVIYKPLKNRLLNKIKFFIFKFSLRRSICKMTIFLSDQDHLYNKIPNCKKSIIQLTTFSEFIESNHHFNIDFNSGYFFSGGASNRNYDDLIDTAKLMPDHHFAIACSPKCISNRNIPHNLTIYTEAYGDNFDKLLINSKAIILPLKNHKILSGQLVLLKALQAGRIVFISRNCFIKNWLHHSIINKGVILMNDINQIMKFFNNKSEIELVKISAFNRKFYENHFSTNSVYVEIAKATQSILQQ